MSGLRVWLRKYTVAAVILVLLAGLSSAQVVEDQFTVDIDGVGDVVDGQGSGFGDGTWYYYSNTDWWNQWFESGPYDVDASLVVEVELTVQVFSPLVAKSSSVQVALNWTTPEWITDSGKVEPPLPQVIEDLAHEQLLIERQLIVPQTKLTDTITIKTSYEISAYCPQWVSIDIRGENIHVEGVIRHECQTGDEPTPPDGDRDFGDAPEGALAYPSTGVIGQFPTCVSSGLASWIEHDTQGMYFGASADKEAEGNGGVCPSFNPNAYNEDEGMQDGDAGLLKPRAYTIAGSGNSREVYPLVFSGLENMGTTCYICIWGSTLDIQVHNGSSKEAYVNLLIDWDQDGRWKGSVACDQEAIPEHCLVNFPIPSGYQGELSNLSPPNFQIGPYGGYVWARFTITDTPVPEAGWTGDGVFADGETEDYLLYVRQAPTICDWEEGDSHSMHRPQLPDRYATGLGVDMYETSLADDYRCTETSTLSSIHFWGGFVDDILPKSGVDSLAFRINIYANQPADGLTDSNQPGELLWSTDVARHTYDFSQVDYNIRQGWFDPASEYYEEENNKRIFQYDICFDPTDTDLFVQRSGTIYWIEIEKLADNDDSYAFIWKTCRQSRQWGANAVYRHPTMQWLPMTYPSGHPYEGDALDLSFVIVGRTIRNLDFGDAPDPTYPTLAAHDGAYHVVDEFMYLGRGVDTESDGQPTPSSAGDDNRDSDDEDGVVFTSALVPGDIATVDVSASAGGVLSAWVDFNGDGDWDDAGEQIFADEVVTSGINSLAFEVPGKAVAGTTFSRWRFTTAHGLSYTGPAPNGEVEDHVVVIEEGLNSSFF